MYAIDVIDYAGYSMKKVIVIGGGPAGLMAAGQAALNGANVTLLEKMAAPARKLRLTGNWRCNLTNTAAIDDFLEHFGRNGKFLRPVFDHFFSSDLMSFFKKLGVKLFADEGGRVYPESNEADEVADALINWALKSGVKIMNRSPVSKIITQKNVIKGVRFMQKPVTLPADSVIIATGGASYPTTGSTGHGYRLAKSLGHSVVPIRPASVPLVTSSKIAQKLQGISLDSIRAKIKIRGKTAMATTGDMLFTHFGVSGPVILSLSRFCVDQLNAGNQPVLSIDLMPEYDEDGLDRTLLQNIEKYGKSQIQTILKRLLPQKMASVFLAMIDIEPTRQCSQIDAGERRKIRQNLKSFELRIAAHRSLAKAMVTAGGVNLKEVNPQTLESRLVKGVYFAGEVLDLDADTGGFNLQAAFSTGWLAGQMSARIIMGR